jgi:crossover junction endodeoxyribonuclease RuvC
VLRDHAVDHVALEKTIFVQNVATAQILGAARGAAIAAAALAEKPVFEYPPLRVKQAVVGVGNASKEQMARTVMALVGHGRPLGYDEADATGVALCHAFTWRGLSRPAIQWTLFGSGVTSWGSRVRDKLAGRGLSSPGRCRGPF